MQVFRRPLDQLGAYQQAQGYAKRALAIRERALGPDHPTTPPKA